MRIISALKLRLSVIASCDIVPHNAPLAATRCAAQMRAYRDPAARRRLNGLAAMLLSLAAALALGTFGPSAQAGTLSVPATREYLPSTLSFTGLDGKHHLLKQWRGKLLLINFWATWCAPCRTEIPLLAKAQTRYGSHGFQIIAPAVDAASAVRNEREFLGINYPVRVAKPTHMRALMTQLGHARGLPFSVLVGPDGHIIARYSGGFDAHTLDQLIQTHLPHP